MTMTTCLLDCSLCMLDGISPAAECALHRRGSFLQKQVVAAADSLFSPRKAAQVRSSFEMIQKARDPRLIDCLVNTLPCGYRVRALHDFFEKAAFIDIETTGLENVASITCISVLINGKMSTFVQGINLYDFLDTWQKCALIVSFNGKKFDLPRILRAFHLSTVPVHIDLIDEAAHFGIRGGLKKLSPCLEFQWQADANMNGEEASKLFKEYLISRNPEQLAKIIAYNQDDVNALVRLYKKS